MCLCCDELFFRNRYEKCNQIWHSDNAWAMPKHCNGCHDEQLDDKFKNHDEDRDICDPCRDEAEEKEEDSQDYDCSVGEIEMVQRFDRKVRKLMLRAKNNTRTLERSADLIDNISERIEMLEEQGNRIMESIIQIKQFLKMPDVNGNGYVVENGQVSTEIQEEGQEEATNIKPEVGSTVNGLD